MKSSTPAQTAENLDASHPAGPATRLWPAIPLPATAADNAPSSAAPPPRDWAWLATQAQRHGLAPLLYSNLQALALNQPHAGPALETLRTAYKHSLLTAMRREGELRYILDGLAAQGICPGVFKGAALAYTCLLYTSRCV